MKCFVSPHKALLFMLLSFTDFVLTWWLLERSGRGVFESNPVADELLSRFDWLGLAFFKVAMVLVVIVLTQFISLRRPRAGSHVLSFACAVVSLVVLQSAVIGRTARTLDEIAADEIKELEEYNRAAYLESLTSIAFINQMNSLCADVGAGKLTLADAVERLMSSEWSQSSRRQRAIMFTYNGGTIEECFALQIICFVKRSDASSSRILLLEKEYDIMYLGSPTLGQSVEAPGRDT